MSTVVKPWLDNSFDVYFFDLNTETGAYYYYADLGNIPIPDHLDQAWISNEPDFYLLDLNDEEGYWCYYPEFSSLKDYLLCEGDFAINESDCDYCESDPYDYFFDKIEELETRMDRIAQDLEELIAQSSRPTYVTTYVDQSLTESELSWARNRQAEWYTAYRKEYNLTDADYVDYVDEQCILDWLAAKFTISKPAQHI